jgi:hypothetical protein
MFDFFSFLMKKTSYLQQEESNRGRGLPGVVGVRRGSGHDGRLGVVSLKGVGVSLKRIKL